MAGKKRKSDKEKAFNQPFKDALRHVKPTTKTAKAKTGSAGAPHEKAASTVKRDRVDYESRVAKTQAYAGVVPLGGPTTTKKTYTSETATERARAQDAVARARLDALVGEAIRVKIVDTDPLRVLREGAHPSELSVLDSARPEATIDLHGYRVEEAKKAVVSFMRAQYKQRKRVVCVVTGQGHHSDVGGVLIDAVREVFDRGGVAPITLAYCQAPQKLGGKGAFLVRLKKY